MRLLIGGSPCTHWSIAQKNNRETEPEGLGWELFKNFLIAKEKFKPDYFLYENNKSAAQPIKDKISKELKTPLQYINSALVSAQNRQRFYCHNIPNVPQPADRGILLKDILESGTNEKGYALNEPVRIPPYGNNDKARPINALYPNNAGGFEHRIWSDNPNKQQVDMIEVPIRIGDIGSSSQAHRVYSSYGKSVTINAGGGGQGGKTGLYACPVNDLTPFTLKKIEQIVKKYGYLPEMFNPYNTAEITDKAPTLLAQGDSETKSSTVMCVLPTDNPIYEVKNGLITIKDKQYPIKLPDGYYIIRKLTVLECKRLQTVRDNYIMPCSASQNYKMLGNGWTVDVIAHILSHIPDIENCEVEVLSMYDGMSCGNLALEKLGCKINKYISYEIDKYAIQTTQTNFPYVIQKGDAFQVRNYNWKY